MVIAGWIYLVSCRAFLFVALSSSLNLSVAGNKRNYIMPELSSECEYSWTEKDISENFKDTLNLKRTNLNDLSVSKKDINLLFLDSLKAKASKNKLIKKIISFIVVNPDSSTKVNINGKNDAAFKEYSGVRIRKIIINKLNVFGSNINNPASNDNRKIYNVFNNTHLNTNDRIIRNNLLFSEGDTISSLVLSENERLLRNLPYIQDARIVVTPISDVEADIVVYTKDVYSIGAAYSYKGLKQGTASVFDKNILGTGHEFGIQVPYNSQLSNSPGFGIHYTANGIGKSFIIANSFFLNTLREKSYGMSLSRSLFSATTKYAGGISLKHMQTTVDFDTMNVPHPIRYFLQDYWLQRSFLLDRRKVSRIIIGARYINNNVFDRPFILQDSYHYLQNYKLFLGSVSYSIQKFYKTNLIYSYGRTEDIPYGGMIRFTAGREFNEFETFHQRTYLGGELAYGKSFEGLGYMYASTGIASYLNGAQTKQGLISANITYFSNLLPLGRNLIRNFFYLNYTRGFDRNRDEHLYLSSDNYFPGFRNDSLWGSQRLSMCIESVLFSPVNLYGFRFAFFSFADFSLLTGKGQLPANRVTLSGLGLGIRVRNDNLVFNTFQLRIGFFPNPPEFSRINYFTFSGEDVVKPSGFDSGPPTVIPYR